MITEIIHNTLPSYHIKILPERYNQSTLKKSKLTLDENDRKIAKLNLEN